MRANYTNDSCKDYLLSFSWNKTCPIYTQYIYNMVNANNQNGEDVELFT